jgi:NAD(P)-dependent dehydrogenase (short-subunit alcohol dehydrogenase family)
MLSQFGAQVICVARSAEGLQETAKALAGSGHRIESHDLDDTAGIPAWLEKLASEAGRLQGLVHAAGTQVTLPLRMLEPEHWRSLWRVNAEAALALVKGFRNPRVYAGAKGSVVLISSVMGQVGAPGRAAYSLSKGAVDGMTRSLALELANQGIRVNSVAPAFVRTRMYDETCRLMGEQQRSEMEAAHPLGVGEPQDVARAVAFLLGDCARWITGTVLVVDGGYTAR